MSEEQAERNACRIEHDVDTDIVEGIKRWVEANGDE